VTHIAQNVFDLLSWKITWMLIRMCSTWVVPGVCLSIYSIFVQFLFVEPIWTFIETYILSENHKKMMNVTHNFYSLPPLENSPSPYSCNDTILKLFFFVQIMPSIDFHLQITQTLLTHEIADMGLNDVMQIQWYILYPHIVFIACINIKAHSSSIYRFLLQERMANCQIICVILIMQYRKT
jgi:hypothetical protein